MPMLVGRTLRRALGTLVLLGAAGVASCESGYPPAPFDPPDPGPLATKDLTLVSLNVYHGNPLALVGCDAATHCRAAERVELLGRHLEALGCPDLAVLQEVDTLMEQRLRDLAGDLCGGRYEVVIDPQPSLDIGIERHLLLSALPVLSATAFDLHAFPWVGLHVKVASEIGEVEIVSVHFASSSSNPSCADGSCPAVCPTDADTNLCHAHEVRDRLARLGDPTAVHIVAGDFNAMPDEPTPGVLTDAGFVDAYGAAGNPECGPTNGTGCTGGDRSNADLANPRAWLEERIDYVMVRGAAGCLPVFDTAGDHDGDGVGTGAFAHLPLSPASAGGPVWPSDHAGVALDLHCG